MIASIYYLASNCYYLYQKSYKAGMEIVHCRGSWTKHQGKSSLWFEKLIAVETNFHSHISQLTFTCSKSTIEPLEKGVKYVQS